MIRLPFPPPFIIPHSSFIIIAHHYEGFSVPSCLRVFLSLFLLHTAAARSCYNTTSTMNSGELIIQFDAGTLVLDGAGEAAQLPSAFRWDERVRRWRAPALCYR